jgi:NADH-quinone oxidoreductase subunit M
MNELGFPLLSIMLWLPALGALLMVLLPGERQDLHRSMALAVTTATFIVACVALGLFFTGAPGPLRLADKLAWIPAFGASYFIGLDGINLWLVLLTSLLGPLAVAATWSRQALPSRTTLALLLAFETGLLGTFLAQDMLLFYIFFEAALVPVVLLIGMLGGVGGQRAAVRMFIYTFTASVLMLVGIIALHILHRNALAAANPGYLGTFEVAQIAADLRSGAFALDPAAGRLIFGAFFIAFAVKLALWPFHTWLPDAYAAAPTPVAILLAGVMAKFGTYGLIRFNLTLFPELAQWAAPAVGILAVIGLIYAATVAYNQNDMQRMVAYSSISHMNMIALGIFALNAIGINGALFQMFAHGITTAALLLIIAVIYERRQSRDLSTLGGLWKTMPAYGSLALLVLLGTMGLPGLIGFVGEFAIMQGVFSSPALGWPFALGATIGVILAAAYALRMFRVAFMGDAAAASPPLADLNRREWLVIGALSLVIVVGGLFPNLIFAPLGSSVDGLAAALSAGVAAALP